MSTIIPQYNIKYKNESLLMKLIGFILFFNPSFMTEYSTTIGNTIYFPSKIYVESRPLKIKSTLAHELVHVKDASKYGSLIFLLWYFMPLSLAPLALLLAFIFPWWIALVVAGVFLLPLPAYGRMQLEKKAYSFSIYGLYLLNRDYEYQVDFNVKFDYYVSQFSSSSYYWMWIFFNKQYFTDLLIEFQAGTKPYYDLEYYEMVEKIINEPLAI